MGATKRLFERMFDRHDYHEIHFRMLEEEYFMNLKTIKMKKLKNFEDWLDEMTKSFEDPMFNTVEKAEEIEYTCCGDEITGEVEDVGLCPTCFEHI